MRELYARFIKLWSDSVDDQVRFSTLKKCQVHPTGMEIVDYEFRMRIKRRQQTLSNALKHSAFSFNPSPLRCLMHKLEAQTYEIFEKDFVKYMQYKRAICKALLDRVPTEEASTTTVLTVVGHECVPLVRASLQAAEETGRKLKVYAVEENPFLQVTLQRLVELESWEGIVTIISCLKGYCDVPEKADIMVNQSLGSFSANELSPESLDGAQRFLKPDGILIPSSCTSYLQPVTNAELYNDIKSLNPAVHFETHVGHSEPHVGHSEPDVGHSEPDVVHFEIAYVVKLHNVARLAPSQPVFTFHHPDYSTKKSNQRYKKLVFEIPSDTGSVVVHGFAGYFDSVLYKDVHLGSEPSTATPTMISWSAMFFPLRTPVYIKPGSALEVHFWRCCDSDKAWYEWCVTSPSPSPVHNSNGRSQHFLIY